MKRRLTALLLVVLLLPCVAASAADRAAEELLQRMADSQNTRGATIRAKLTVEDTESDRRTSAQIRIKLRRDANVTRMLYQVLWPESHKGEAIYIERTARGSVSGFVFEPPEKVTSIAPATMNRPYLDSDLTIEDLADEFWLWPSQRISGEEAIRGELCRIVDSRPPAGVKSGYSLVRSWVSPEKLLPLRIEKFARDERLAKRFTVMKTSRHEGIWVPMSTLVQSPGRSRQTTLELSRGDRDVEIPHEEFSLQQIRKP